jgi:hypothetical protein
VLLGGGNLAERIVVEIETKKGGVAVREFPILGGGKYFKRKVIPVIPTRN